MARKKAIKQRIPVLADGGTPIASCHPVRARQLLRARKARIERRRPFTIRMIEPPRPEGRNGSNGDADDR